MQPEGWPPLRGHRGPPPPPPPPPPPSTSQMRGLSVEGNPPTALLLSLICFTIFSYLNIFLHCARCIIGRRINFVISKVSESGDRADYHHSDAFFIAHCSVGLTQIWVMIYQKIYIKKYLHGWGGILLKIPGSHTCACMYYVPILTTWINFNWRRILRPVV